MVPQRNVVNDLVFHKDMRIDINFVFPKMTLHSGNLKGNWSQKASA